ncbi:HAD family hydrolase [Spiroplasma endosymbiont of Othius punctulatus]|uniref:HAD family hydrolase n=1 Tax=Spiroplasma endosymbiont of Othius punctulatus TaxID=3066289 RepID=UPI0030D62755
MKRIYFSDLDGTLLKDDYVFSEKTKEVVKNIYAQGDMLIPITARGMNNLLDLAKELELDKLGGIVCGNNGATVYSFKEKKYLIKKELSKELMKQVWDRYHNNKPLKVTFNGAGTIYGFGPSKSPEFWAKVMGNKYVVAKSVNDIKESITHLVVVIKKENAHKIEDEFNELQALFGDVTNIVIYDGRAIEIAVKDVDKGQTVKELIKILDPENKCETFGFGDGPNDFSLLGAVDIPVAMKQGNEELKKIAKFVAEENFNDGVANFILNYKM